MQRRLVTALLALQCAVVLLGASTCIVALNLPVTIYGLPWPAEHPFEAVGSFGHVPLVTPNDGVYYTATLPMMPSTPGNIYENYFHIRDTVTGQILSTATLSARAAQEGMPEGVYLKSSADEYRVALWNDGTIFRGITYFGTVLYQPVWPEDYPNFPGRLSWYSYSIGDWLPTSVTGIPLENLTMQLLQLGPQPTGDHELLAFAPTGAPIHPGGPPAPLRVPWFDTSTLHQPAPVMNGVLLTCIRQHIPVPPGGSAYYAWAYHAENVGNESVITSATTNCYVP